MYSTFGVILLFEEAFISQLPYMKMHFEFQETLTF